MTDAAIASLTQLVLWSASAVGALFGAVTQRTGFCTMGAVSDIVTMGDWTRMRQWALASGIAMLGFAALAWMGFVSPDKTLYTSTRWLWLSALVGGGIFGFGMVLASGCASKTLVRVGGGSLKSLVVMVVLGIAGFATLKGITAVLRTATVDRVAVETASQASLPAWAAQLLPVSVPVAALAIALAIGLALLVFALADREFRGHGNNLLAGVGVGIAVLAMWWVTGDLGHVAEHPQTLEETFLATNSGRAEGLSFVAPIAYSLDWLMFFSDKSKLLSVGIVTIVGVILGSAAVALAQGSFRWEGFRDTADLAHHLTGAVLMGVGGVTAIGCSIGQGVSGVSTLSATSFVAATAMIAGAVVGLKYQMWRLQRLAAE